MVAKCTFYRFSYVKGLKKVKNVKKSYYHENFL